MSSLVIETYASQGAPLGEELAVPTDRVYRYTKNGPKPLAAGTILQGPRPNTSHDNLTCAAAAVGKTEITVTLAAGDPVTINDYKNGYIFINDEAGEGYVYDIVSTPGAFGEDVTCKFKIKQQLVVALTTSSQATLIPNIYENVSRPFGDPWDIILGVAPVAVPANEYFWCQVRGPAAVLQAGGLFAGRGVMLSQNKPGAVEVLKQVVPIARQVHSGVKEITGTATIVSGQTTIVVTHGLGKAPSLEDISVTAGEAGTADWGNLWVDNISSTQFTINCRTDPSTNNLDLGWRVTRQVSPPIGTEAAQFQQKGVEQRLPLETLRKEPDEVLTEVAGKATIPERVIGYCINPRVSEEYALVYLTLS
ncbi:hypothetical protein LCGC14_1066360 [marine sediment metagenome]|uniref:Uncharacterized protein n=1 Tax=marine sediment metagenome TaxID=412755 RepID=A0A0F9N6N5_9ZZZZ